jgi:predicted TIM-barrel fold metal-dependent hydrolase
MDIGAVELFGADRCMFGSHLPIDGLSHGVDRLNQADDRVRPGFGRRRQAACGRTA